MLTKTTKFTGYFFSSAPGPEIVVGLLGCIHADIRDKRALISERSSAIEESEGGVCVASGGVDAPAAEVLLVASVDAPSGVVDEVPVGVLPVGGDDVAGLFLPGGALPAAGLGPGPGDWGLSILPRMIGRPPLPLPMITIFEFLDCASASVASIPRQRRYESEIPLLTVRWKAAMPFASICFRFASSTSRLTRYLNS